MGSQSEALRKRAAEFALAVLKFIRRLPRDVASDSIIRQVARSAAGVSANYRAACFARSRAEFVSRLAVAVEEAGETNHWLWMAGQLGLGTGKELERLLAEGHELQAILCSSLGTARRNLRRDVTSK
jgi:four helix bundle protein